MKNFKFLFLILIILTSFFSNFSFSKEKSKTLLDGKNLMNAYQVGPTKGPDGFYHLAWCWRDHFGCESNHDLQYAKSKDLIHWQTSSGKTIDLPITIESGETVDPIYIYAGLLNNVKMSFDSKKRCILTYFKFDQDGNTQVYAARREKNGWKIYQVTNWTNRWDFNGGGSIPNMIVNSGMNYKSSIGLFYGFRNRYIFGDLRRYIYIIDEETLKPISKPIPKYPDSISKVKSPVKGMNMNLSGHFPFFLHWEALIGQRDIVKDLDWVPKDQMLQLVELEWNSSIKKLPYVPPKNINASYKKFFSSIKFKKLDAVKVAIKKKNYQLAVKILRKHFSKNKNPKKYNYLNRKKNLNVADMFYNHIFDFDGIKRTLLFDIITWYPIKNDVLENWDVTWVNALQCKPIKFDELNKISPLANWYNQLNSLPHLSAFGKAYAISKKPKYARKYIHDLEDWMYDNPVPAAASDLPGPWYITLAAARLNSPLTDYVNLFARSKAVSNDEFFFLMNSILKHEKYLKFCIKSKLFSEIEKKNAAEILSNATHKFPGLGL